MPEARYKRLQLGQEKKLVLCRKIMIIEEKTNKYLRNVKKKLKRARIYDKMYAGERSNR